MQHTYDAYGRKAGTTDSLGISESYTYDVNDLVIAATGRDGKTTVYTYDGFGHELSAIVSSGETVLDSRSATCDGMGRILTQVGDGLTISYTYSNELLTAITETGGAVASSTAYTYNARGQRTGYTLTIGGTVKDSATYAYDLMGEAEHSWQRWRDDQLHIRYSQPSGQRIIYGERAQ